MDIFHLKLELIDFSQQSSAKWRSRRIFIGFLLYFYYTYAAIFFFVVAFPQRPFLLSYLYSNTNQIENDEQKDKTATEDGSTQKPNVKQSKPMTTESDRKIPPLLIMVTFGFIGGVFFITRTFVRTTQKVVSGTIQRQDVPVMWYLTRPLQSAMMAIFIYYAFRAGQIVFYSMEGTPAEEQINVFTLSLLAIIAGAFSEQAFEKLHSIATSIFKFKTRTE